MTAFPEMGSGVWLGLPETDAANYGIICAVIDAVRKFADVISLAQASLGEKAKRGDGL